MFVCKIEGILQTKSNERLFLEKRNQVSVNGSDFLCNISYVDRRSGIANVDVWVK